MNLLQIALTTWFVRDTLLSEGTLLMVIGCISLQVLIRYAASSFQTTTFIQGFPMWHWAFKCATKVLLLVMLLLSVVSRTHRGKASSNRMFLSFFASTMLSSVPLCCPKTQKGYVIYHASFFSLTACLFCDPHMRDAAVVLISILELGSLCTDVNVMFNTITTRFVYSFGMTLSNACGFVYLVMSYIQTTRSATRITGVLEIGFLVTAMMIVIRQWHMRAHITSSITPHLPQTVLVEPKIYDECDIHIKTQ